MVTLGPWTTQLIADLGLPLRVTRQEVFRFMPADETGLRPGEVPVFTDYDRLFYGFPLTADGIKVADDHPGRAEDPDAMDRRASAGGRRAAASWVRSIFPTAGLQPADGSVCMYTLTPDRDFIIDRHPWNPSVAIGAGFSGHGFKFAPLVGRLLVDLAAGSPPSINARPLPNRSFRACGCPRMSVAEGGT